MADEGHCARHLIDQMTSHQTQVTITSNCMHLRAFVSCLCSRFVSQRNFEAAIW